MLDPYAHVARALRHREIDHVVANLRAHVLFRVAWQDQRGHRRLGESLPIVRNRHRGLPRIEDPRANVPQVADRDLTNVAHFSEVERDLDVLSEVPLPAAGFEAVGAAQAVDERVGTGGGVLRRVRSAQRDLRVVGEAPERDRHHRARRIVLGGNRLEGDAAIDGEGRVVAR